MPIERDFLDGNGTLPILFKVNETIEVWDGQVALIVDQLLNHIKVLTNLAEGPADESVFEALSRFPRYQTRRGGFINDATPESVSTTLIAECIVLLRCLVKVAPIMKVDQDERNQILEAIQAKIPFLDYHYIDSISISDAQRED